MDFLSKAVQKSLQPKESITRILKRNLEGFQEPRPIIKLHASDLTKPDFCPRAHAIINALNVKRPKEWIGAALKVTFDMGNETADKICEEWGGDKVIGDWECIKCNDVRHFTTKPTNYNCKCGIGACVFKYKEVNFVSQESGVSGNVDVFFNLGAAKYQTVELKTIAPDQFADLKMPLAEHSLRTNLYLHTIETSKSAYKNMINLKEGRVFYVSRGHGKKHTEFNEVLPFKEFTIKRDDTALEHILGMAKELKTFREGGAFPSRQCANIDCKMAEKCLVKQDCFSNDY